MMLPEFWLHIINKSVDNYVMPIKIKGFEKGILFAHLKQTWHICLEIPKKKLNAKMWIDEIDKH